MIERLTTPKVSIVVPVYNMNDYLAKCINSLISQTYQAIEVILVNDGSTDNSGVICDEFARRDDRIRVIHQENGGLSNARNNGTKAATGDFILYLDSDDWIDKETCMVTITTALQNSADIVFWSHKKEYADGQSKEIHLFDKDQIFQGDSQKWLHRRMIGLIGEELSNPTKTDAYNSAWGKLYRRSIISDNEFFFHNTQEIGSEDVLFNIQVFFQANKIIYVNSLFNHYRQDNPNAITKNHNSTLFPRFLNLFKHIEEFIKNNNLHQEYKIALKNRIALSMINNSLSITYKRNPAGFVGKIISLKQILKDEIYYSALKKLELKYLPFQWQVFFVLCRLKCAIGVYFLTIIMRKFR